MLLATLGLLAQMAVVPADSGAGERVGRGARAAQARFERTRRMHLPRKPDGGGWRPCDAEVGRFCYWYDSTRTEPDPEPRRIKDARLRLLETLDSAVALAPMDPWIAGQRVRYYLEAGLYDDARSAAGSCRAEPWWCSALTGLVHHVAQRYAQADSAFRAALGEMPDSRRCEWMDIRALATRWDRALRDASCRKREELTNVVLTLGQPLWMIDGNDLRTEHLARHTMASIHHESANAHGMAFGDDSRELLLRYGWAEWYTRHEPTMSAYGSYWVTGHDREPSYHFLPDVSAIEGARPEPSSWKLREQRAHTRYAPRHIERMTELRHQLARFVRGDSMLIVAAWSPTDSTLARDAVRAALATWRDHEVSVIAESRSRHLAGMAGRDTLIVSVEVLGDSSKHAARERYTVAPLSCETWCLSDLLLVDHRRVDSTSSVADALAAAYPELRMRGGSTIGVFFELVARDGSRAKPTQATVALSVTPIRIGAMRRLAARLGLANLPDAVRMRWPSVIGAAQDRVGQVVSVRIPASARAGGRYRMQLTITPRDGEPVTAWRDLEIFR